MTAMRYGGGSAGVCLDHLYACRNRAGLSRRPAHIPVRKGRTGASSGPDDNLREEGMQEVITNDPRILAVELVEFLVDEVLRKCDMTHCLPWRVRRRKPRWGDTRCSERT